jgi:hypothetical protein
VKTVKLWAFDITTVLSVLVSWSSALANLRTRYACCHASPWQMPQLTGCVSMIPMLFGWTMSLADRSATSHEPLPRSLLPTW